jgi:hypothetical protein
MFCRPITLCRLLHHITETIQVPEGCMLASPVLQQVIYCTLQPLLSVEEVTNTNEPKCWDNYTS